MEPRREENQTAPQPGAEPKLRRFRIVKLEDRIAPSQGGHGTHNSCGASYCHTFNCPSQGCTWSCTCGCGY
jgi:hypothetical protein